jgi:hypothetical protein
MFNEGFLKKIGFTEFEHLDKSKRDLIKRLVSVVFVDKGCFTIQLIYQNDEWKIEKFSFEGDDDIYKKYFPNQPDLENIINTLFPPPSSASM